MAGAIDEMGAIQSIIFDKLFTKGFVQDDGTNKIPEYFAQSIKNIRIVNWGITVRDGQDLIYEFTGAWSVNVLWVVSNDNLGQLYCIARDSSADPVFYSVDYTLNTVTAIWTLTGVNLDTSNPPRFITFWSYTIILTWLGRPYYYDGVTFWQVTTWELTDGINPRFWAVFGNLTFIVRTDMPNVLMSSRPIDVANPWYCKDWLWTGSTQIVTRGKIQAVVSSLNRMRIFTDKTIEYISADNLTSTGWVTEIYSVVAFRGEPLPTPDSVCAAWEALFFVTQRKDVRAIWYEGNVVEPQVKTLSSVAWQSIIKYMEGTDLTYAWWYFDSKRNLAKLHLIDNWSISDDAVLAWDITNTTFLRDEKLTYGPNAAFLDGRIFINYGDRIVEDEVWWSDNAFSANAAIPWYFITQDLSQWVPDVVKQNRDTTLAGQIGNRTRVNWKIYLDVDNLVFDQDVVWAAGWLEDFEKINFLRRDSKKIRYEFSGTGVDQQFVLDYLELNIKARKKKKRLDRVFWDNVDILVDVLWNPIWVLPSGDLVVYTS